MAVRRPGHGPNGLKALLDAMEAELLSAPVEEVHDALRETSRARDAICREVLSVLNEAAASSRKDAYEGQPQSVVRPGTRVRGGVYRH